MEPNHLIPALIGADAHRALAADAVLPEPTAMTFPGSTGTVDLGFARPDTVADVAEFLADRGFEIIGFNPERGTVSLMADNPDF